MNALYVFVLTIFFSSLAALPPGLINMNAANISIKKGVTSAKKFVFGVLIILVIQSFLGFYFATFLKENPQTMSYLKIAGSLIFCLLTLFFLGKGIQNRVQEQSIKIKQQNSKMPLISHGMMLGLLNIFPIPYLSFLSLYFSTFIPNMFTVFNGTLFVLGTVIGMGLSFYLYIYMFKKLQNKIGFFIQNINFIIAFITALIAVFTIYNL